MTTPEPPLPIPNPTNLRAPTIGDMVFFYPDETLPPFPAVVVGINSFGATTNDDHDLALFVMNSRAKTTFFLATVKFSDVPASNRFSWQTEDSVGRPEGIVRPVDE